MALLSGVTSLASSPGALAIGAGVLAGAVTGTAVVASGVLSSPEPQQLALVACPNTDIVVARVTSGQSMLVMAKSGDGSWLELYIGEPGVDSGWAPAADLRVSDSLDSLPVRGCEVAAASLAPGETPTPTPEATPTPTPLPSGVTPPPPTPTPFPTPTPTPKPTPTPSPLPPGVTASPFVATPLPPPPPPPTDEPPPPPTEEPPPPPTPNPPPVVSNLARTNGCIDNAPGSSSTITVTATDPGDTLTVRSRFGYRIGVNQFYKIGVGTVTMSPTGGNQYSYTITGATLHSWGFDQSSPGVYRDVELTFEVTAYDSTNTPSGTLYSHNLTATQIQYQGLSSCSVG